MPMPEDFLIINGQYHANVDFTINQQWMDEVGLAIKYDDSNLQSSCDVYELTMGAIENFQSKCINGMTEATIVVYMDDGFNPDECVACDVEDLSDMGGAFCAYRLQIPCEKMPVVCED